MLSVRSVVGQMFVLQVAVVVLQAIGAVVMLVLTVQRESTREASNRSLAVAQGFASSPGLVEALESRDPTAVLQPRVEEAGKVSGVDFVGVLKRDGIYYAISVPGLIGARTSTDMAPLLAGRTVREEGGGALGPEVRAYIPVKAPDGSVVGVVSAGITIETVSDRVAAQLPVVLGATAGAVAVTMGGAMLLSRRLLRQTHGLGPAAITRMYEHHDAVLHSVKEGVVILNDKGRLLLANDEARRLLDLPPGGREQARGRARPAASHRRAAGVGPGGHRRGAPRRWPAAGSQPTAHRPVRRAPGQRRDAAGLHRAAGVVRQGGGFAAAPEGAL